jgi:hypothetical protein
VTLTKRLLVGAAALGTGLSLLLGAALAQTTPPPMERTLCVWTAGGAVADTFNMAKSLQSKALGWGVKLNLKQNPEEGSVSGDFKSGACDAALLSGVRAQDFNRASYTVEALGGITDYNQLKVVTQVLANPKNAALMKSGSYETAGIIPGGMVYILVKDRTWTKREDLAGKRMAVIGFDKVASKMVTRLGAVPVEADLGTFAAKFNGGDAQVAYSTATAYQPFELGRGIGTKGGILKFGFTQFTFQVVIRADRFPVDFGQKGREWARDFYDEALKVVVGYESKVPAAQWVPLNTTLQGYEEFLRTFRIDMAKEGLYKKEVLAMMKAVRCKADPTHWDCALPAE